MTGDEPGVWFAAQVPTPLLLRLGRLCLCDSSDASRALQPSRHQVSGLWLRPEGLRGRLAVGGVLSEQRRGQGRARGWGLCLTSLRQSHPSISRAGCTAAGCFRNAPDAPLKHRRGARAAQGAVLRGCAPGPAGGGSPAGLPAGSSWVLAEKSRQPGAFTVPDHPEMGPGLPPCQQEGCCLCFVRD